jgi:hypothetical protein
MLGLGFDGPMVISQQLLLGPFSIKMVSGLEVAFMQNKGSHLCVMESLALMRKPGQPLLDLPGLSKDKQRKPL